jgi:hypothetical protein
MSGQRRFTHLEELQDTCGSFGVTGYKLRRMKFIGMIFATLLFLNRNQPSSGRSSPKSWQDMRSTRAVWGRSSTDIATTRGAGLSLPDPNPQHVVSFMVKLTVQGLPEVEVASIWGQVRDPIRMHGGVASLVFVC